MNRTQKKCFIASAGFHLLLVVVLFVGPAFLSTRSTPDDTPILDFVPGKTVDSLMSGGGNRNARPPEPVPTPQPPAPPVAQTAPPPPPPQPQPQLAERVPDPPKEAKVTPPDPESLQPSTEHKPRKPEVSTTLVTRRNAAKDRAKEQSDAQAKEQAREYAQARQRVAQQIGLAASSIESAKSGATSIEMMPGPGGGGVPYANFLQAVKSVYARAWVVPDGVNDDDITTAASVTIARDGHVITSHIVRSSGNREVDISVQATLDRVTYAAPLPDNAKEDQRTVTINFNVRAKRLLG